MTKNEAEDLHLAWMDGYYCGARMKRSSIAQSIRDAAVNWPQFLGDVESDILCAFCISSVEDFYFKDNLRFGSLKEKNQSRTFMLLVAEALE